jgi:hypothetical protein
MSNRILINPGTPQSWEIVLQPGVNRIGSSDQNDFIINHPSVGSTHCEILVGGAGVFLKDLDSVNGTYVNRTRVREVRLLADQPIQFGAIAAVFLPSAPTAGSPIGNQPAPGATIIVAAFGSSDHSPAPGENVIPQARPATESQPATPAAPIYPRKFPVHFAAEREARKNRRFLLGLAGAGLGGLLGVVAWYFLIKSSGSAFAFVAWGVGAVTGLGARLLAKTGSMSLGIASAVCALLAIAGGEYLAVQAVGARQATQLAAQAYRAKLEFARTAVQAETPDEFRKLIARQNEKNPEQITDEEIKNFQEQDLPALRDFAQGKPAKAEFVQTLVPRFAEAFDFRAYFFKEDLKAGLFLVLFAALGIATAYKLASGESSPG